LRLADHYQNKEVRVMNVKRNGNKMVIEIELDPEGWPSSTGKSLVVFSSGGFVPVDEELKVNLTVIKKRREERCRRQTSQ
jgi:hypothetical protein